MNISDLIQNTNHVYVDNKLMEDYQRQSKKVAQHQKSKSPKEMKAMRRLDGHHGLKNKSPVGDKTKSTKDIFYKVPIEQPIKKVNSRVFSEEECIEILTKRMTEARERQIETETRYQGIIKKLKQEVQRVDKEYDFQLQEYEKIKSELAETKRDIASLIDIIKITGKARPEQSSSSRPNDRQMHSSSRSSKDIP